MKNDIKFIFFGGSDFSVKILEILYQNDFIPQLIITTPDKPRGRKMIITPPPVKLWAQKNNIKISQPEKLDIRNLKLEIGEINIDFAVIAAYGKIIPKEILDIPKCGTLNVHPSLLPKFRGPSPIQSFILSGEQITGVTIMLTDEQVDHGAIIAQRQLKEIGFPLGNPISKYNYKELEEKLTELGGKLLVEIIPDFMAGKIKPQEQDHSQATFTKKITKQDGLINLETDNPETIIKKIRAFMPWPNVYYFENSKRIIITKAELIDNKLKILRIKPGGKNEMDFNSYLSTNGTKAKPG